jgi:imidazolonepropionase-like amidohydrolase
MGSHSFASDAIPAKPQDHPIALVGGTIYTVTGQIITGGTVVFDKGKIIALGTDVSLPVGTEKIDVKGKYIYPGFVDASTDIGLVEIGSVRATVDRAETGRINPNVRAEVAINPESEIIPVTRANGVTVALTAPEGGLICGTSALIMLDGWTWEDMTLKAPVGLHVNWPRMTVFRSPFMRQSEEEQKGERDKQLKEIRDAFAQAKAYMIAKHGENQKGVPYHQVDLRWEAMIPALEGKMPVFVNANEVQQIQTAVAWAEQEKVKIVIVGGQDAWRAAELLKARDIPVILNPILTTPSRDWEAYDAPFAAAVKLSQAGVTFCIAAEGGASDERNLPYHAAMASAYGLPKDEALKAITVYPSKILGVVDKIGSLEIGKDATLIITDGDPLEIMTNVEREFIQGRDIDLRNKHKTLYEKYKEKYRRPREASKE